ncbi:hypothetical protein [Saccharibacillus alkalitolerans]|uniref:Uncharacterized protein n=1 Tax=Saccharibacillus alkalitolerans TaxID=2705290 RepID=A0ABX0F9P5_9BACL|nr:hypothetical protein [Saccharibacillus alkalitolerans]NGZ77627.1 hypothetical protein [Saccharibacillus alkalitolerans]
MTLQILDRFVYNGQENWELLGLQPAPLFAPEGIDPTEKAAMACELTLPRGERIVYEFL